MVKGTISIFYKGELIDRKVFLYGKRYGKEEIIQAWKHKYGQKYYDEKVEIKTVNNHKKDKKEYFSY